MCLSRSNCLSGESFSWSDAWSQIGSSERSLSSCPWFVISLTGFMRCFRTMASREDLSGPKTWLPSI